MDISFLRAPTLAELRDSGEPLEPGCQLGLESALVRRRSDRTQEHFIVFLPRRFYHCLLL